MFNLFNQSTRENLQKQETNANKQELNTLRQETINKEEDLSKQEANSFAQQTNLVKQENMPADFETLQKARKDLIGELDAIIMYDDHIHASNNAPAKATWEDIRNEELVHVGQLLGLITFLAPYQKPLIDSGLKEFSEMIQKQN